MAKRQPYGLTLAVLLVGAMAYALSQTMVVPALPEIQRQLDTTSTTVTFVLTGYLLTAAVAKLTQKNPDVTQMILRIGPTS